MDKLGLDIYIKSVIQRAKDRGFVAQKTHVIDTPDKNTKGRINKVGNLRVHNNVNKSIHDRKLTEKLNGENGNFYGHYRSRFARDIKNGESTKNEYGTKFGLNRRHKSKMNNNKHPVRSNASLTNGKYSDENFEWLKEIDEDIETYTPTQHRMHTTPIIYDNSERKSALVGRENQQFLQNKFVTQNATLLSVACLGALLLIAVNLVGVLCCKGYFRRKVKTIPSTTYPRPRSWLTRRPQFEPARQYSLDSQAATIINELRDRHIREDPIFGQSTFEESRSLTLPCRTLYGLKKTSSSNNPSITITTNGIEMTELNAFDVTIEDWETSGNEANKDNSWKELLKKFHLKKKTFKEKTDQANTTGYFS